MRLKLNVLATETLTAINTRTKLVTHSIGAGSGGDVIFMFLVDICGETENPPAHAKAFGDLRSIRKQLADERRRALSNYRTDVISGSYPDATTSVSMLPKELDKFISALDKRQPFHQ